MQFYYIPQSLIAFVSPYADMTNPDGDPWAEGSRQRAASKTQSDSLMDIKSLPNQPEMTNAKTKHIPDERRYLYHHVNKEDTLAGIAIVYGISVSPSSSLSCLLNLLSLKQWRHHDRSPT